MEKIKTKFFVISLDDIVVSRSLLFGLRSLLFGLRVLNWCDDYESKKCDKNGNEMIQTYQCKDKFYQRSAIRINTKTE